MVRIKKRRDAGRESAVHLMTRSGVDAFLSTDSSWSRRKRRTRTAYASPSVSYGALGMAATGPSAAPHR
jgi:hypothetical protein